MILSTDHREHPRPRIASMVELGWLLGELDGWKPQLEGVAVEIDTDALDELPEGYRWEPAEGDPPDAT